MKPNRGSGRRQNVYPAALAFSRYARRAKSTTTRSCVPAPIASVSSVARTVNSMRRPSTSVTSASPTTLIPSGVAPDGAHRRASRRRSRRIEIRLERIERRILHYHDHDRRRPYRKQRRVLELIGEMLGPHEQFE